MKPLDNALAPICIDLQIATDHPLPVSEETLLYWIEDTVKHYRSSAELTVRMVSSDEIKQLNTSYRQKEAPTNVLAFPSTIPSHIPQDIPFLGDVVICPEVLDKEALNQHKTCDAHWAHIIIHGILHLLGYDHIDPEDESKMQNEERSRLRALGFMNNPYDMQEDTNLE